MRSSEYKSVVEAVYKNCQYLAGGEATVCPCIVQIRISAVLKNTPDLHSVYHGFLAFSDHLLL